MRIAHRSSAYALARKLCSSRALSHSGIPAARRRVASHDPAGRLTVAVYSSPFLDR